MVAALIPLQPGDCPLLVVKVGSALLVDAGGALKRAWLESLARDIAGRVAAGQRIVVVSSGAIALGARQLGLPKGGRASLEDAQAAAATGQILLSQAWAELLALAGLKAAQILLTLGDLEDRRRFLNAAATLERLLGLGVVPVINENDSVATEEIRFGDNDRLAARVAQATRAQGILLLSNVDGLYSADPARDSGAALIEEVRDPGDVDASIGGSSAYGSGGMASKLAAARIACASGIPLVIASGIGEAPLAALGAGGRCTRFVPGQGAGGKRNWLAGRLTSAGTLTVDTGAARALRAGHSLLAAGLTRVDGRFGRGDVLDIADADGRVFARGLSAYDAADVRAIAGTRSGAQAAILGYAPRSAVVHRDQLALL